MDQQIICESEIKIEEEEILGDGYNDSSDGKATVTLLPERSDSKKAKGGGIKEDNKSWNEYIQLENQQQTYYCSQCPFETKWKCYLRNHIKKIHSSPEVTQIYKCMQCKFKSKWKFSLSNHMKVHSTSDSLKMYKCTKCSYQSKWNNALSSHMKVHILPKTIKLKWYKCVKCNFESKNKLDLELHTKVVHSPLQTMYKCPLCSFETKFRHGVNKHVKVHNNVR